MMKIMLILIWLTRSFKAKAWKVRRLLTEMTNQPTNHVPDSYNIYQFVFVRRESKK